MYKVCGTKITMVRGDTFVATVTLCRDTPCGHESYIPSEQDLIKFNVKRCGEIRTCISKVIPNDTMELLLRPEDTANLPDGLYEYDLRICLAETGDVDTIIASGKLRLLADIPDE